MEGIPTTLERVLLIAPELKSKVSVIAQKDVVAVTVAEYETTYAIEVDGVKYEITSPVAPSEPEEDDLIGHILTALKDKVELDEEAAITVDIVGETLLTTVIEAGVPVILTVSDNMYSETTVVSYNGLILFELLLEDVILQITEMNFREEMERAQRYLIAHLLTLANISDSAPNSIGNILQEVVGDVQYRYGNIDYSKLDDAFYGKTNYGIIFFDIMKRKWFRFI